MNDLKFAVRQLFKRPLLAAVIVISLAVGIGANTLVFTWIRATLFDAIPGAPEPQQLAVLVQEHKSGGLNDTMSLSDIESLALEREVFAGITASQFGPVSVRVGAEPEWLWGQLTMANFFDVLGVKPVLGRGFLPGEDRPGTKDQVAVISHELWQRNFQGAADVLGRVVQLDRRPVTIVGVAPPGFIGAMGGLRMDLWVPLATAFNDGTLQPRYTSRGWRWLHTVARLAPGVSVREANAAANAVGQRIAAEFPESSKDSTLRVIPVWEAPWGGQRLFLPLLRVLAVVAALLLLLVTANVANLLLARAHERQREMSLRLALGASTGRVIRQLLAESTLLAVLGGAGGVALALIGAHWLLDLLPQTYLPISYNFGLDWRVLGLTAAVTLVTGLLFGLAPALNSARTDLNDALKAGSRSTAGAGPRQGMRRALVIGEVALALVLLLGMGLCFRSLAEARRMDLGLDPRGVWVAGFRLNSPGENEASVRDFYQRLLTEAARLPGVEAVGLADWFPLGFEGGSSSGVKVPGYEPVPGENMGVGVALVSPGYFEALRIPLRAGRDFTAQDNSQASPVAIVNEAFAKKYFAGSDPVGRTFNSWRGDTRIVGVVATGKYNELSEASQPFLYLSAWQTDNRNLSVAVRTSGDPRQLAQPVLRLARSLHPDATPHAAMTYEGFVSAAFAIPTAAATLLGVLGALALLLAVMGLYAVMSQSVAHRVRELGVRLALGANPRDVLRLVLRQGLQLTGIGLAIGAVAGLAVSRLLASLLVGISAADTFTWLLVPPVLMAAAFLACWLPARRASRVDPMAALRSE